MRLAMLAAVALAASGCAPSVVEDASQPSPPAHETTGPLPRVASAIVADDENVYWSGSVTEGSQFNYVVAQRPVGGGATIVLATATRDSDPDMETGGLAGTWINHRRVFWFRFEPSGCVIESVPIGGGATETVAADGCSGMAVDDEHLYFASDEGNGPQVPNAISLATAAGESLAISVGGVLALDGEGRLLATGPSLERVSLANGSVEVLSHYPAVAVGAAAGVVTFQTGICQYSECEDAETVFRLDPHDEQPKVVAPASAYTLDDAAVYAITGSGKVTRTELAGGASTVLAHADFEALGVAVNRHDMFWLERIDGSELRVRQAPLP